MPVHMPGVQAPPQPMTMDAFLEWVEEDIRAEWVNGEVRIMVAASIPHNLIQMFLLRLLAAWLEFREAGWVLSESFLHLPQIPSLRVPDLMVVRQEHLDRVQPQYVEGPADLVVEIVSPDSVRRDYVEKYREYAEAGVPEYWIVDPGNKVLTAFTLAQPGRYEVLFEGSKGKAASKVLPGFWLQVAWLWQEPLPPVHRAMRDIGGEAYRRWLLEA